MIHDQSPEATLAIAYDEGAAAYDEHWAPALHRHARALLDPLPTGTGLVAVDVAAGVGTLAGALRGLAGRDGLVVALDRSLGMLRRAPQDLPRVQADAARLPLADGSADVLVFAFVLFMLPDARPAVAEAARTLRPRGWFLAATWGSQLDSGAGLVVREELDRAGAPPFPPLPRSDELTDTPARMRSLLEPAGFTDVRTDARPLDAWFDRDSALALRTGCGSLGWRFARLDAEAQGAVRRGAAERLTQLPAEDFVDRSEVLLSWARRSD
ncbi:MAG: class I SAM-dependent methyltransferase [Actinomycetes bacterium]